MSGPRPNQKLRTRKDLLEAAARLMREGRTPSFEEIAEAALVSRATAYRYFPGLDALLLEAALDVAVPTAEAIFAGEEAGDPVARLERLDAALSRMMAANEAGLRVMLAQSVQRAGDPEAPVRQNRRSPLIAEALEPARAQFAPEAFDTLSKALVPLLGIEAVVAFKDVLRIPDTEARRVRLWAIRALVEAARKG
ncbi:MAG: TetR family transcriptional regulator [Phenylobacterium sp.]|uniref:TetR/AcrR family transcriptional regulator n=1 Tax=Phenylobacterium sp. TaxID=1871053 RepID=UPI001213723F|nr:TetR family transcriptional regulator [Phenylobacterium sp.]TAJ68551.1 MAG: TetR family transcriptional regulator [Phenylobacterium sp.]